MEGALLIGAALSAAVSALVALSLESGGAVDAAARLVRRSLLRSRGLLGRLGRGRAVSALLARSWGLELSGAVAQTPLARSLGLSVEESAAALVVGWALACLLSGLLMMSIFAGATVGVALVAFALVRDARSKERMRRELSAGMPGIYRTLSVAMGSGQTLSQAVEYVGRHESGPAAAVFTRMSLRLRCGMGVEDAVERLSGELGVSGSDLLATALVISHRTGSPLRELLMCSARLVERQGEFERLLAVKTAQVRLSVRIVCLLPVVMVGLLALISPDFQEGLLTVTGISSVVLALMLDGVALVIIRHLVAGAI